MTLIKARTVSSVAMEGLVQHELSKEGDLVSVVSGSSGASRVSEGTVHEVLLRKLGKLSRQFFVECFYSSCLEI